jgi:hypothetical protein
MVSLRAFDLPFPLIFPYRLSALLFRPWTGCLITALLSMYDVISILDSRQVPIYGFDIRSLHHLLPPDPKSK